MQVEIVTPESITFQGQADMVIVRSITGEMGILSDHETMVTALGFGELRLYTGETVSERFGVFGGFLEVRDNIVSVLSDDAIAENEIDKATAETDFADLQARLGPEKNLDDPQKATLRRAQVLAQMAARV